MINWHKVSNLLVFKQLRFKKDAVLLTENSDGTTTSMSVSELAALNDLGASDLSKIDGITNGTAAANKALVLGASKEIATITSATITTLTGTTANLTNVYAGASGTAGSVDVFPATAAKGKLTITCADQTGDTAVTLKPAAMGQATQVNIPDPGAAASYVVQSTAALTLAEADVLDGVTPGTLAASKAWTSDASLDTVMPTGGLLTVQSGGAVTFNTGSTLTVDGTTATTVAAAEYGAGALGTAATPKTRRWTDRGVIVTQTTFDLTGLASVATANDVIGLAAGGTANIGRNVVATNGVIFKAEFSCLETPAGGDNDVNVVTSATSTLAYDGAGGTTYISNSGDLLAGQTIQNLVPAMTEGDYFYLTAGTGDTAATYTAGMYVLTTYGHPVLA